MTAQEHSFQRDLVLMAANREDAHDQHGTYAKRKPVLCMICEETPPRGFGVCDGCREAWMEQRAAAC